MTLHLREEREATAWAWILRRRSTIEPKLDLLFIERKFVRREPMSHEECLDPREKRFGEIYGLTCVHLGEISFRIIVCGEAHIGTFSKQAAPFCLNHPAPDYMLPKQPLHAGMAVSRDPLPADRDRIEATV